MIAYLKGKVLSVFAGGVVLENNGIGYEVFCSGSAFAALSNSEEGAVYTYMHVKEDGISLYGFSSQEEKNMFLKLISVSGIGAKMGITILSAVSLNDLAFAIANSDVNALSKIKGCGKKTAERIILELREKISSLDLPEGGKKVEKNLPADENDAVIALMSLGFSRAESKKAVETVTEQGVKGTDNVILAALKNIGN